MKSYEYPSFAGGSTSCEYTTGRLGDQHVLVIKQAVPLVDTSITNQNELIVRGIFQTDPEMLGVDPATVRVFEHYPSSLNPAWEWAEVSYLRHVDWHGRKSKLFQSL